MENKCINTIFVFLCILIVLNSVQNVDGGDTCTHMEKGQPVQEYCEYGCCGNGNDESCCSISKSVLLVACIVSGLVLIALVAAIIVCCYKNYKDKQATRVRRIRQEQDMNAPRVPGVEPPKPPSYVSAPPAYSEEMPESHFRPATVTGNIPYNQRFRGTTPAARGVAHASISMTNTSGRQPMANARSSRNVQIPGAIEGEAPPPYSEFIRGQTPAHRRRRFIRTPVAEGTENVNEQNIINSTVEENTDIFSEVSSETETASRAQETRVQGTSVQSQRAETSRAMNSRATESRAVTTRAQESRVETIRESETRAESVARILRPSGISRIPTRVHGAQSRQLSDVQSRASSIPTRQTTNVSINSSVPRDSSYIRRNPNIVEENIDLAAI